MRIERIKRIKATMGGRRAVSARAGAGAALLGQLTVPAQHGVGPDQQPESAQDPAWQQHRRSGQEGSSSAANVT
ncbi:hypothetical protein ACQ4WX_04460 [Streptomyces lasalocidi]